MRPHHIEDLGYTRQSHWTNCEDPEDPFIRLPLPVGTDRQGRNIRKRCAQRCRRSLPFFSEGRRLAHLGFVDIQTPHRIPFPSRRLPLVPPFPSCHLICISDHWLSLSRDGSGSPSIQPSRDQNSRLQSGRPARTRAAHPQFPRPHEQRGTAHSRMRNTAEFLKRFHG